MMVRKKITALVAVLLGALTLAAAQPALAEKEVLSYSVDVATNYVFRGIDMYQGVQDANSEARSAFNVSPSLQPSFTFPAGDGFSVNLWGAFALVGRDVDGADLAALDELDITLAKEWENKLGSFTTGYIVYNGLSPRGMNFDEVFFKWGLPFAKAVSPEIAHYADPDSGNQYTSLAISGGDKLTWGVSLGLFKTNAFDAVSGELVSSDSGPQDVTAKVGYAFGDHSVAFNLAHRPDMEFHGYDANGQYTNPATSALEDGPATIFWISYSYGGSVKE